ncbi:unnamed protein product [Rotaria sp. Silwood2]|nr:unnamed protein product [Rotaria sp. Silwood2]
MLTEKKTFFSSLSGYYALAELHTFYTCSQADLNSVLTIFTAYRAGLTKHSLPIDNSGVAASFSYSEKGSRNPEKPSIVFVHGLSSNKETWIPIIKVSFTTFYEHVPLLFFVYSLAKIANEASETDLIRQLRTGVYNALLPETSEELRQMIHTQTVKRPKLPGPFVNGFLHLRLLLTSLLEYDSSRIEDHYQHLRLVNFPALILWGRQDKVYAVSGAEFFHNLLPNSKCVIFDDCGHFLAIDKPEETARNKYNDVEPISTDLSSEQVLNPFQCSYRCRVLYHYPPEVPNNTFDEDTISRLSMPDGVSIRQNSSDPSTTHPFLIARLDGTRYYAVALTFSEQINNDDESLTESLSTSSSSSSTTIN